MKMKIDPFDYAGTFAKHMGKGILLTTKGQTGVNTMTIGWGTIGIEWGRPMFVAYVRESRYTRHNATILTEKKGVVNAAT